MCLGIDKELSGLKAKALSERLKLVDGGRVVLCLQLAEHGTVHACFLGQIGLGHLQSLAAGDDSVGQKG